MAEPEPETATAAPPPPPGAFCQATGVVYQTVGAILAISTCCCWGFGGSLITGVPDQPPDVDQALRDVLAGSEPHQTWYMLSFWLTFVSGLAALAIGLSLQHERPHSGRWALFLSGVVAAFFWSYVGFGVISAEWTRIVVPGVMALVWTALFLLAGVSADQLKRFPPPREPVWTPRDEDDLRRSASPGPRDKTNP